MFDLALIHQCAPNIAPETIQAIIEVESSGNPLALNVNANYVIDPLPQNKQEAINIAKKLIDAGYSVDMGLMQINNQHLETFNLGVEEIFDDCRNIKIGSHILNQSYESAIQQYGDKNFALLAALSAYNTGDFSKGFSNGYVARYFKNTKIATDEAAENPYHATTSVAFNTNP